MQIRLQTKALLSVGLLMVLCLGAVLAEGYRSLQIDLIDQAERRFNGIAGNLADGIYREYEIDDWRGLESFLYNSISRGLQEVLTAAVLDTGGSVVASSRRDLARSRLRERLVRQVVADGTKWSATNRDHEPWTIEILSPVCAKSGPARVKGVVYLVGSLQGIQDELASNLRHQILIFLIVSSLGLTGTLLYMRRGIVRPIRQLSQATQRVVAGDFRESGIRRTRDEIGELTAAFDWMASELRKSDEFLKDYNQTLMQMVAAEQDRNRLDNLISSISYALIEVDSNGIINRWNKAASEIFDLSPEAVIGRPIRDVGINWNWNQVDAIPGDIDNGGPARQELVSYVRRDGSDGFLTLSINRIEISEPDSGMSNAVLVLLATDVSDQKLAAEQVERYTRTLNTINRCRNAIVRASAEEELLQAVCQTLVDVSGYGLVWVGLTEDTPEKGIRPVAQAGVAHNILNCLHMTWGFGAGGLGAAARAVRTGNPQVVRDFAADPDFARCQVAAASQGFAAAIVLPLTGDKGAKGTLNIYAVEAGAFQRDEELKLLMGLADDLAHGIGALRAHAEARRASLHLEESLSLMRATLESTADGLLVVDLRGRIVTYNIRFAGMWGVPLPLLDGGRADHLARFVLQQLAQPRDFLAKIRELNARPEASGGDVVELIDGRIFERYSQPQLSGGGVVGRIWSFRDVTLRRRAECALQASEEYHRALIDNTSDIVLVLNSDGTIRYLNSSVQRVLGYSPEELVGRHFKDVIVAEDLPSAGAVFEEALANPQTITTVEVRARHKDGSTRLLDVSGRNLLSEERIAGMIINAHDITARRESEAVQGRLAAAVEQAAESIVIFDATGIINYANPAFEWGTGLVRDRVINQSIQSLLEVTGHDEESSTSILEAIAHTEWWRGRLASRRLDGALYNEEATITPVYDQSGKLVNYVWVGRDITQQVALESQLRQAQKLEAVGSLAAGIAHEINTPIQFVGDNVRFLSDSFGEMATLLKRIEELVGSLEARPELAEVVREFAAAKESADLVYLKEEVPKAVEQTLDGVARVAKIVRAMKDFSHPDQGQKGPADLNRALQSTLTVAHNELKYVADIVVDLEDDLPSVLCHLSDLNQVFLNLLVNAAHAIAGVVGDGSNGKGKITVRTRRVMSAEDPGKVEGVTISVTDTGTGIPEEIRDRVFEQFFTTKEVGRGTGQGLAIARAVVVEKHGGRIWFETKVGSGTTFFVHLPIGAEELVEAT
ncbi:MAG: PAS domain S-box protein [candidate division Zixibacteria bacterium]|nr:PAS domain S-box protein [candidate division Zixibacteria bacterium]